MHQRHDRSLKSLFSHREMVEYLIRGFMKGDWVEELDFDSLEPRKSAYISHKLDERLNDVVWRIRCRGSWLYLFVVIEFQNAVDQWMAIRLNSYVSLLYEDIIKTKQLGESKHLPPVLPIVFYNGSSSWTAVQQSSALLSPAVPAHLKDYFPQFQYELLDIGHHQLTPTQRSDQDNPLIPLIELEQCADNMDTILGCIRHLGAQLAGKKFDSLRRAFVVYLSRSLELEKRCPGIEPQKLDLREFETVLRDRLQAHEDRLVEQTMQETMQKTMQKAMRLTAQRMLQENLDEKVICKISHLSEEALAELKAESLQ
jgi:predicted transposase YdaD